MMDLVEKKAVHVQIMPEEAVNSKKAMLEVQLNLLSILKNIISVKELRAQEIKAKTELRINIQEVLKNLKGILDVMPIPEEIKLGEVKVEAREGGGKKPPKETRKLKIEAELEELKKQIALLGSM